MFGGGYYEKNEADQGSIEGVVFYTGWPGKTSQTRLKEVRRPACRYLGDESVR